MDEVSIIVYKLLVSRPIIEAMEAGKQNSSVARRNFQVRFFAKSYNFFNSV